MKKPCLILMAIMMAFFTLENIYAQNINTDVRQTFANPVIDADFPDVDVARVGDDYYLLSTTMHHFPGAVILHSRDLVHWAYCAAPLKKLADTDGYNQTGGKHRYHVGMWASALKYHDGKFYLLINTNDLGSFLMTATDVRGAWTMKHLDRGYYDSNILFDTDGRIYIVSGNSHISISEVDKDFNFLSSREVIVRENSGLEGNHLYHIGNYYYIYSTYGGLPSGQAAFRSKTLYGDYEEKVLLEKHIGGKPNTVHQGVLIETQTGEWWSMLFEDRGGAGRLPNLQPVTWTEGWPLIGDNGKPYSIYRVPDVGNVPVLNADLRDVNDASDDFSDDTLGLQWEWNHQQDDSKWSLTQRPGYLRLYTCGKANTLKYARNTLTQRILGYKENGDNIATVKMDVSRMTDGDVAGLTVFQDPYAYIAVKKKGHHNYITWQMDTISYKTNEYPQKEDCKIKASDIVYLRASVNFIKNRAQFFYSADGENYTRIGKDLPLAFNLSVFVGERFGIFNFAMKNTGGFIDVDYLHFNINK